MSRGGLPDGDLLMAQVRAALPAIPMRITGDLQSRDRRGNIVRVNEVEMILDWGGAVPSAEYIIRDRFGAERERFKASWPLGEDPVYVYATGDPPKEQVLAHLSQPLLGLDMTWADLSLSFLWWSGARTVGAERVRGRYCYIVDLPAPPNEREEIGGLRLWVDADVFLLMQVDTYDKNSQLQRRMQIKSLRKLNDYWMVQNLDIHNHQTRERITLRVRKLQALDGSLDEDVEEEK